MDLSTSILKNKQDNFVTSIFERIIIKWIAFTNMYFQSYSIRKMKIKIDLLTRRSVLIENEHITNIEGEGERERVLLGTNE